MNRFGSFLVLSRNVHLALLLGSGMWLTANELSRAQERDATGREPQRWAVIFVGLPGDSEHEATFSEAADQIQKWLTASVQIPAECVLRLPGEIKDGQKPAAPLTAESMRSMLADVNSKLAPDDALWVFTLGHGSYDGRQGWFHVAGKDPSGNEFGRWMADLQCREQVIWLTQSSSGWFVKPLSRPGRIVIAATATDDESNETEFPHALAAVARWSLNRIDADQDQAVSVVEFYTAVVNEVARRFQSDNRLPTEHSQLDDNGDGLGTEEVTQSKPEEPHADEPPATTPQARVSNVDGDLARTVLIPYPDVQPTPEDPTPAE